MVDGAVHKQNFYSIFCSLEQVHLVQLDGVSIEISPNLTAYSSSKEKKSGFGRSEEIVFFPSFTR